MNRLATILLPQTRIGTWATGLALNFIIFLMVFYVAVDSGQRGGATFFSNPLLAVLIIIAALSGVTAFVVAAVGIVRNGERSVCTWISLVVGLFVLFFIVGEIATPH